jgi:ABC-type branched-subunit amino acid transport system ATPase component
MSMAIARAPHAAGEAPRDAAPPVGPNSVHLTLEALEKRYGNLPPSVTALSLQLRQGEFLVLLGPSGCGKTTTLRMVAGFVDPSAGRVTLGGEDITHRRPGAATPAWCSRTTRCSRT